jgi:hypothetical protein
VYDSIKLLPDLRKRWTHLEAVIGLAVDTDPCRLVAHFDKIACKPIQIVRLLSLDRCIPKVGRKLQICIELYQPSQNTEQIDCAIGRLYVSY